MKKIMGSISNTVLKMVLILAILGELEATSDECSKNIKQECKKILGEALCQEIHVPIEATVTDPCCLDLVTNVGNECFVSAIVDGVKQHCKLKNNLIKRRSSQIWSFCNNLVNSQLDLGELGD